MRAVYDINFNGFNVGTFEFQSQAEQQSYTLLGNAQLSMLLGAFTWIGETRSFGLIVNQAPKPAAFTFDFKSNLQDRLDQDGLRQRRRDRHHAPAARRRRSPTPCRCASSTSRACSIR